MADRPPSPDRRRPTLAALRQPVRPVTVRARLGTRDVVEPASVLALTDRTVLIEVDDAPLALALCLAPEVHLTLDLGKGEQTVAAEPGRRTSDNPTSRRVELVIRDVVW